MRATLAKAISQGIVQPLGQHSVVLGGARVDADVYMVGDTIHLEVDCNKQTMDTRLGSIQMDGTMHIEMNVQTFQNISRAADSYGARLLQAAEWLTNRPPLLRDRNS